MNFGQLLEYGLIDGAMIVAILVVFFCLVCLVYSTAAGSRLTHPRGRR